MATHIFGECVDHDVRAVLERPAQGRGRHRVVDYERYAVTVGGFGQRSDINHATRRVADGLAEHRACVFVDQRFQGGDVVVRGELYIDALPGECMGEQVICSAIQLADRYDVVADL